MSALGQPGAYLSPSHDAARHTRCASRRCTLSSYAFVFQLVAPIRAAKLMTAEGEEFTQAECSAGHAIEGSEAAEDEGDAGCLEDRD